MHPARNHIHWSIPVLFSGIFLTWHFGLLAGDEAFHPDPRVKPGARFTLSFPKLQKDRHGNTSEMEVSIPKEYDPNRYHPLLIFMAGADGSSKVGSAARLADADKFILAGMPYPKGANNPGQANMVGNFPVMWAYHKKMLQELHKVIPNINPDLRVLAGFSNGGHCIDGILGLGATEYFNVFILADGGGAGGSGGRYRSGRGCHMFICWGEKSPNKRNAPNVISKAKKAGMSVKAVEMKGIGHKFDEKYMDMAREWLENTVAPEAAKAMLSRAKKAKTKRPVKALAAINGMKLLVGEKDEKLNKQAQKILDAIEKSGERELKKIKSGLGEEAGSAKRKSAEKKLQSFIKKYQGTKAATEAEELLEPDGDGKKEKEKEAE
ncbi:MAG: hypothetical protein GXP25_23350 [Planctomycetes bacterium]|nr:hypothetical protein [Planctomycetota bacterium]